MVISKLRKEDERCADIVSRFLDKNFYNGVKDFQRIEDVQRQVKGIDVIFNFKDKNYVCDEKAAIRYINKGLGTFSLELSFIDRGGNIHDGWLLDENKVNNSFLFIWIDKADKDILFHESEIKELEIALVDRDKIIRYLESLGWDADKLLIKGEKMRDDETEYGGNIYKHGCKFVCSRHLVEQPVNVLLSRDILKKISDFTYKWEIK